MPWWWVRPSGIPVRRRRDHGPAARSRRRSATRMTPRAPQGSLVILENAHAHAWASRSPLGSRPSVAEIAQRARRAPHRRRPLLQRRGRPRHRGRGACRAGRLADLLPLARGWPARSGRSSWEAAIRPARPARPQAARRRHAAGRRARRGRPRRPSRRPRRDDRRLADDHANARRLADGLAELDGIESPGGIAQPTPAGGPRRAVTDFATSASPATAPRSSPPCRLGASWCPYAHGTVRAVTHYGVDAADVDAAIVAARVALAETAGTRPVAGSEAVPPPAPGRRRGRRRAAGRPLASRAGHPFPRPVRRPLPDRLLARRRDRRREPDRPAGADSAAGFVEQERDSSTSSTSTAPSRAVPPTSRRSAGSPPRVAVPLQVAGGLDGPEQIRLGVRRRRDACRRPDAVADDEATGPGVPGRRRRLAGRRPRPATGPARRVPVAQRPPADDRRPRVRARRRRRPPPRPLPRRRRARRRLIRRLVRDLDLEVLVAGGIVDLAGIRRLRDAGIAGIVLGEALLTGRIPYPAALEAAA